MVKEDINLLAAARRPAKEPEYKAWLQRATIILLGVYLLTLIGVFSAYFYFSQKEKGLAVKIEEKENQIKDLAKVEYLQRMTKKRLLTIDKILIEGEKGIGLIEALTRVRNLMATGYEPSSIGISDRGGVVLLRGRVLTLTDLAELMERSSAVVEGKRDFETVVLNSLTKNPDGYDVDLYLKLAEN